MDQKRLTPGITRRLARLRLMTRCVSAVGCRPLLDVAPRLGRTRALSSFIEKHPHRGQIADAIRGAEDHSDLGYEQHDHE